MLRVFWMQGDAYALLCQAVRLVWDMEQLPEIARQPDGKPYFPQHPQRHFNLSHSGDLALCALSDAPVGADIECIRPRKERLPAYVCRGDEWQRYQSLGGDWPAFYTLWTERESILKYTGEGLKAMRHAHVPEGCVISHLSGGGWKAAVCGHETVENMEELHHAQ